MRSNTMQNVLKLIAIAGALLSASLSSAADRYLLAESFLKNIPDDGAGIDVTMWGFAECTDATFTTCGAIGAPGPQLEVDLSSDTTLTVHVKNMLPIPVSLAIPGLISSDATPLPGDVDFSDALSRSRTRSLVHETPHFDGPGDITTYSWALRHGTFLYHSGTASQLQVPMGLYGALIVRNGPEAYPGITPDSEVVMLMSEVDPIQNGRVDAAASGGTPPTNDCATIAEFNKGNNGYPCTIDYFPVITLVNGAPSTDLGATTISDGDEFLLRMLNAGQKTHVPSIVNVEMDLIAEDAFPYPGMPRRQAQAALAAGKTLDALVQTEAGVDITLPFFDREPSYNNEAIPNGGGFGGIIVGNGTPPPGDPTVYAVDDVYAVTEDTAYIGASVLGNDVGLVGSPTVSLVTNVSHGTLALAGDGTFTYTPSLNFSGADTFAYAADDGTGSYPATVTLNVSFVNDGPTANDDGPYVNTVGTTISVDAAHGVLGNDIDPDGDSLTAILEGGPIAGLTLNADGSFEYTGGIATSFSYHANDGTADSGSATVTIESNPVANITLDVNEFEGGDVNSYRWIVQEDTTFEHKPDMPGLPTDGLSINFHKSYMPVIAQGCVGVECDDENDVIPIAAFNQAALDPTKRYYVSVLPNDAGTGSGHTLGGAQIPAGTSGTTIEVLVNPQPVPTAQISVFVFEDNVPTNGVPDPGEKGLGGFNILIEDAAGTYGQGPGFVQMDVDGVPLTNALASDPGCYEGMPPAAPGVIVTCADGTALIKNLPPGKFGIITVPRQTGPGGTAEKWSQTSTIEGSKVVDTWIKAGEPPYFVEFGPLGYHVFHGYVNPANTTVPDDPPGPRNNTIVGKITPTHVSRPPDLAGYDAGNFNSLAHTRPWIGLNSIAGNGANIATVQADMVDVGGNLEAQFTIDGIPDGTYQLVVWDDYLDIIIYFQTVILSGGASGGITDVGNVVVPPWFGRHEHVVFLDENENGIRDDGELPLPEQNINLRFRSGGIYQAFPTDTEGFVPFDTIFPFGSWLVAEVDFARYKATGVTVTVDGGGDNSGGDYPGLLNPQDGSPRTETGVVLTEGFHSLAGNTSLFEWGKKPYEPGENGGVSGIVFYGSTRGENNPRLTVGDTWEPGIPGVTVRLWQEIEAAGGGTTLRLVDEVKTDSWDDSLPEGCPGETDPTDPLVAGTLGGDITRCYDSLRNFEQVRPGALFDGGYAFDGLDPGAYVVEVVPPNGYEIIKEEDKNVDFGDAFAMAPAPMMAAAAMIALPDAAMVAEVLGAEQWGLAAPECVGPDHTVPATLSLFPGEVDTYAPYAGADRPLCTHKRVILHDQANAAADFHLFTSTPVAGQYTGLATDDIAIETDLGSPNFGDKWGPAFMPITQRDYNGNVVYRGYTDRFGKYNGMVPSTFSANLPIPSGYSPAMHSVCLNDPTLPDGTLDPYKLPQYGTFCYTLMYMPGLTTYLDTPMLPQSAFAAGYSPVDCALPEGYPVVSQVDGTAVGPLVESTGTLTIYAKGVATVPNPEYEGPLAAAPYDVPYNERNYGFGGDAGTVMLDNNVLAGVTWSDSMITAPVGGLAEGEYELVVINAAGQRSINTVTVTVGTETPTRVTEADGDGAIQAAIDAASAGDLIIVEPGTYDELVVMWKPLRLQGSGSSTIISAVKFRPEKVQTWRNKVFSLVNNGDVDLLPNQPDDQDLVGPGLLTQENGPGITVLAKNDGSFSGNSSRIDGLTVTGAEAGGGIFVNGYAHGLTISNNNVTGNSGSLHGGIRFGHPDLGNLPSGPVGTSTFGYNQDVQVHHNSVTLNGTTGGQGVAGGVAICTGTDGYQINDNYICGNFNLGDGGGIGHYGLSDNGVIANNQVLFNQTFNQGQGANGGGIHVAGEVPVATTLTLGSGDVDIDRNQIQGNQAGSGQGGGIRTQLINGEDTAASNQPANWWAINITNNMVVNNMAGWSGGGISMQDTANATIVLNTIANNDSTGTVGAIIGAGPQPAGISSEAHSLGLNNAIPGGFSSRRNFSNPVLTHNIIWHNRAFTFSEIGGAHLEPVLVPASHGDCAAGAQYLDLGVLDPSFSLSPARNILTSTAGYPGNNLSADPEFLNEYCNTSRTLSAVGPIQVAFEPAEGGNAIDVRYGPLSTTAFWDDDAAWNYHIASTSPAIDRTGNQPTGTNVGHDFDDQVRPNGPRVDVGADEYYPVGMPPGEPPAPGSVAYSSGAFGAVPIGSTATRIITATVSGNSVTFNGSTSPAAPFARTVDNCNGQTVTNGNTCSFTVTYSPTAVAADAGSFTVNNNGDGNPHTVSLSGNGVEPSEVQIASASFGSLGGGTLNFGTLPNNPDPTSTITLSVNGAANVKFGTLSLSGSGNYTLGADSCSGSTLTPPATCTFAITFDPQGNNVKNATVSIPHDSVGAMSLALTGQ